MDKRDKFSIAIFSTGLIIIILIILYLPSNDTHIFNMITVIGSVSSTTASIIAIIQILKIKSSNDVYMDIMQVMGNNFIIDVLSRSIEQVRLIKEFFEMEEVSQSRSNFSFLKSELIIINSLNKIGDYQKELSTFINFLTTIETKIYDNTIGSSKEDFVEVYKKLSELESLLQEIRIKVNLDIRTT